MAVSIIANRQIARVEAPERKPGHIKGHVLRSLISGDDPTSTDPFLVLAEDWVPRGAFPMHPHRGIETVTYVVSGVLEHSDSKGNKGLLYPGDAQWMTAGSGVLHEENPPAGMTVHALQLWVNMPATAKMSEARYQDLRASEVPRWRDKSAEVKVFSGQFRGLESDTLNHVPVLMLEINLNADAELVVDLPGADQAFVLPLEGQVEVGEVGPALISGQLGWLTRHPGYQESQVRLASPSGRARVLLLSAPPLEEPVVFGGPFVMNTQEEIQQAFRDFAAGSFKSSP